MNKEILDVLFSIHSTPISCIYLLELGTVKQLRKVFQIDSKISDLYVIYKFGLTKNLKKRFSDHQAYYGKLPNVNLRLIQFIYIDRHYLYNAENDVKQFFESNRLILQIDKKTNTCQEVKLSHREIVAFDHLKLDLIIKALDEIVEKYSRILQTTTIKTLSNLTSTLTANITSALTFNLHERLGLLEHNVDNIITTTNKFKQINRDKYFEEIEHEFERNNEFIEFEQKNIIIEEKPKIILCEELVNSESKKIFECFECGKKFSSKFSVSYHMSKGVCKKEQDKEFKCTKCKKIFSEKKNLQYHTYNVVCDKIKKVNNEV